MSATGCILYVIAPHQLSLDSEFEAAQKEALKKQLPLAVTTYISAGQYAAKLAPLQRLEATLGQKNIPLIILIGDKPSALVPLVTHSKPANVYKQGKKLAEAHVAVQRHPYMWPGVVIKTDALKKLIDKNEYMC